MLIAHRYLVAFELCGQLTCHDTMVKRLTAVGGIDELEHRTQRQLSGHEYAVGNARYPTSCLFHLDG